MRNFAGGNPVLVQGAEERPLAKKPWSEGAVPAYRSCEGVIIISFPPGQAIYKNGGSFMNIMDGMDAARFKSANPDGKTKEKAANKAEKKMPMVLRNLNNK